MQTLKYFTALGTKKRAATTIAVKLNVCLLRRLKPCMGLPTSNTLIVFLLLSTSLQAQDKNAIGVNFVYGAKVINQVGTYKGIGVSYIINTIDNEAQWARMLNAKSIVIEAVFNDMSNVSCGAAMAAYNPRFASPGYFGNHITLTGAIDIRIFKTEGFSLFLSPTVGLLYTTKNYFNTGGVNQLMSRPLNAIAAVKLKLELPLSTNTTLQLGADAAHISNSSTSQPNVGLDRISTSIGILQNISYARITTPKFCLPENALTIEIIAGYTAQQTTGFYQLNGVNLQLDNTYRVETTPIAKGALCLGYHHYLNDVLGVKAGADIIYSQRLSADGSITSDTTNFIKTFQGAYSPINSHFNVGLNAGIDLCLGRLVFGLCYGFYAGGYQRYVYQAGGNKFEYGPSSYITYEAKYYVTEQFALSAKSFPRNFGGVGVNFSF
jgi:hypothetical protein